MSKTLLTVILPVLLGTIAIAFNSVLKRKVMKSEVISPIQCLILYYAAATAVFGMVYVSFWGFTLPNVLPGMWTAVMCGVTVGTFIQFFNMKAASIDKGEVSLTAPLQAMTPGLITGLALLLGEYPSRIGIAGIILMAVGSYILLWEKTPQHWYYYFGPIKRIVLLFKLGHLSKEERNKTIVVTLAIGSAFLGTFGLLFDGLYTRRSLTMQGLVLASMGYTAIIFGIYSAWYLIHPDAKPTQKLSTFLKQNIFLKQSISLLVLAMGILWVIHIVVIWPTFNHAFVAYIGTLKRFSILMSVILGYHFFGEEDFKKRLWAAIFIIAGAILIATDDLPTKLVTKISGLGI